MPFLFEVYYRTPRDPRREKRLTAQVAPFGGRLTCVEGPRSSPELRAFSNSICLTYEFDDLDSAEGAADRIRALGEHVEGPSDYRDGDL